MFQHQFHHHNHFLVHLELVFLVLHHQFMFFLLHFHLCFNLCFFHCHLFLQKCFFSASSSVAIVFLSSITSHMLIMMFSGIPDFSSHLIQCSTTFFVSFHCCQSHHFLMMSKRIVQLLPQLWLPLNLSSSMPTCPLSVLVVLHQTTPSFHTNPPTAVGCCWEVLRFSYL
jgi:hypothetical protein